MASDDESSVGRMDRDRLAELTDDADSTATLLNSFYRAEVGDNTDTHTVRDGRMGYRTSIFQILLTERAAFVESLKRQARRAASVWTVLKIALLFGIFGGFLYLSGDAPLLYYVIVGVVVAVAVPLYTISKGIREDLGYTQRESRAEQLEE